MRPILCNGTCHVEHPETTPDSPALRLDVDPLLFERHVIAQYAERLDVGAAATELVGIGQHDRPLGAVDLDDAVTFQRRVEAQKVSAMLASLEGGEHLHCRRHL